MRYRFGDYVLDTPCQELHCAGEPIKLRPVLCGALAEALTLAARLGPEAMHHLRQAVLALAQDTVQRYDGILTQVSGEGFLALFGAP